VRREGQGRGLAAERLGSAERGADHRAVAAVHAVEIANRHHGAVQRPDIGRNISILRAVADEVEACGFAHFRVMFVSCRLSRPVTVSARLINFQINRIFNASGYLPLFLGEAHCGCSVMAVNTSIPILIVDDYNTMIRIIRNLLRQLGFEQIDEANDGSMALAKMRTRQYGLVISDWNMEPMTGYDLLQVVRNDPNLAETPFIMVTAESKTDNVIAAKRAGVSNYIVKPFNAQTLKSKIDAVFLNR
jgi:two-component system chemotaxis response regulator CheY